MAIPRVFTSVVPDLPKYSPEAAARSGEALAGLGQTVEGIGQHFIQLEQTTEVNRGVNAATLEMSRALDRARSDPFQPYTTLAERVQKDTDKIREQYVSGATDPEVAHALEDRLGTEATQTVLKARDLQRGLAISTAQGELTDRIDQLVERAATETGTSLDRTMADLEGTIHGAVAAGSVYPEEGQRLLRNALSTRDEIAIIHQMTPDPHDPVGSDARLVALEDGLNDGTIGSGLDPLQLEKTKAMVADEIERRNNAAMKPWPNDPDTLGMVRLDQATLHPRLGHADLFHLYKEHKLSETTYGEMDDRLTRIEQVMAGGGLGGAGDLSPSDVRGYAEKYLNKTLKMDGLAAQIASAEGDDLAAVQSTAFGEWVDAIISGQEPWSAAKQVADKYREQVDSGLEGMIKAHTFHVPDDVREMALQGDFVSAAHRLVVYGLDAQRYDMAVEEMSWIRRLIGAAEPVPEKTPPSETRWNVTGLHDLLTVPSGGQ